MEAWDEQFLEEHEELWPLKEALERAIMQKSEAIAVKEALEAEVAHRPLHMPPPYTDCSCNSLHLARAPRY